MNSIQYNNHFVIKFNSTIINGVSVGITHAVLRASCRSHHTRIHHVTPRSRTAQLVNTFDQSRWITICTDVHRLPVRLEKEMRKQNSENKIRNKKSSLLPLCTLLTENISCQTLCSHGRLLFWKEEQILFCFVSILLSLILLFRSVQKRKNEGLAHEIMFIDYV